MRLRFARDPVTIVAARRLLERRDAGRNLPSYHLALLTTDAAAAFVRGDMRTAAAFAEAARQGMFHGRSLAHLALLEADARAALSERKAAEDLYRRLLTPDEFAGNHLEAWPVFEQEAESRLGRLTVRGQPEKASQPSRLMQRARLAINGLGLQP